MDFIDYTLQEVEMLIRAKKSYLVQLGCADSELLVALAKMHGDCSRQAVFRAALRHWAGHNGLEVDEESEQGFHERVDVYLGQPLNV